MDGMERRKKKWENGESSEEEEKTEGNGCNKNVEEKVAKRMVQRWDGKGGKIEETKMRRKKE